MPIKSQIHTSYSQTNKQKVGSLKNPDLIFTVGRGVERYQFSSILLLLKRLLGFFIAKVSAAWQKIGGARAERKPIRSGLSDTSLLRQVLQFLGQAFDQRVLSGEGGDVPSSGGGRCIVRNNNILKNLRFQNVNTLQEDG